MWKKIAIAGGVAAVIAGAGTAALAETSTPSPSPKTATTGAKHAAHPGSLGGDLGSLRNVLHAQWVTKDKTTHDAIRGSVTAVTPTSITVTATDGVSQTYAVTTGTKVHVQGERKGATTATIASIKAGEPVLVTGTGTTTLSAKQISEGSANTKTGHKKAKASPSASPATSPAASPSA